MVVSVGDKLPDMSLTFIVGEKTETLGVRDFFSGRNVVVVGLPGAFTPVCSSSHVPDYIRQRSDFKEIGVDEIVIVSVNDAFVMNAWVDSLGARGKLSFIVDHSAEFVRKLGLDVDLTDAGLGIRSGRWSMLVSDGVIKRIDIEPDVTKCDLSGASCMINRVSEEL